MIGILAPSSRSAAISEFFELLKTPWEFVRPGRDYPVVISLTGDPTPPARLTLLCSADALPSDANSAIQVLPGATFLQAAFGPHRLALCGPASRLRGTGAPLVTAVDDNAPLALARHVHGRVIVRLGFDPFTEVARLLADGQPIALAHLPSLDLQLHFVRALILNAGLPLIEIPPAPAGYPFIACLTHDVDHPFFRAHRFDRTHAGYLRRALIDSTFDTVRGRLSLSRLARNVGAALKSPFVHLGIARDPWADFIRYRDIERDLASTFYLIPDRGRPGLALDRRGAAPALRASGYGIEHIDVIAQRLRGPGCEVGLHGLDAWSGAEAATRERQRVAHLQQGPEIGLRMHWLYFDRESPAALEAAGFTYDSTVGYNETVGYRAGTSQVYRPLTTTHLLELPLHVMDTALFYPSYLHLTETQAVERVRPLLAHAVAHGGTLTYNWHDRSLFPERQWEPAYLRLIADLREAKPWFATAGDAVAWFRQRRASRFASAATTGAPVAMPRCPAGSERLPALRLRTHAPRSGLLRSENPALDLAESHSDEVLAPSTSPSIPPSAP